MRALILKDFLIMERSWKLIIVAWLFMNNVGDAPILAVALIPLLLVFLSLGIDDREGIDPLLCSLPVSRADIVRSRYLSTMLVVVLATGFTLLFKKIQILVSPSTHTEALTARGLMLALTFLIIFLSLLLPLFFKFGTRLEYARGKVVVVILLVIALMFAVPIGFSRLGIKIESTTVNLASGLAISLAIFCISSRLALRFYNQREF